MQERLNGDDALRELIEGNKRFVAGKQKFPNSNAKRRAEVAKGQHPFAIIVGCSDSRVPPEIIFDRGLGDLFIIRTAGNVIDEVVTGSIEFAVENLGVQLVVVLGHSKCGAVGATMKCCELHGHIGDITKRIKPSVDRAKDKEGDAWTNCVQANVEDEVKDLKDSKPILFELVKVGKLKIVGGMYCVDSGLVQFLK